jgi:hypothetical protein
MQSGLSQGHFLLDLREKGSAMAGICAASCMLSVDVGMESDRGKFSTFFE